MSIQTRCTYPIPITGFLRLKKIIGDPLADPPIPPIFPVSRSTWWAGVKPGRSPAPVRPDPRTTAWRTEDIHTLSNSFSRGMERPPRAAPTDSSRTHPQSNEAFHD